MIINYSFRIYKTNLVRNGEVFLFIWAALSVFRSEAFLPKAFKKQKRVSTQAGLQIRHQYNIDHNLNI